MDDLCILFDIFLLLWWTVWWPQDPARGYHHAVHIYQIDTDPLLQYMDSLPTPGQPLPFLVGTPPTRLHGRTSDFLKFLQCGGFLQLAETWSRWLHPPASRALHLALCNLVFQCVALETAVRRLLLNTNALVPYEEARSGQNLPLGIPTGGDFPHKGVIRCLRYGEDIHLINNGAIQCTSDLKMYSKEHTICRILRCRDSDSYCSFSPICIQKLIAWPRDVKNPRLNFDHN